MEETMGNYPMAMEEKSPSTMELAIERLYHAVNMIDEKTTIVRQPSTQKDDLTATREGVKSTVATRINTMAARLEVITKEMEL